VDPVAVLRRRYAFVVDEEIKEISDVVRATIRQDLEHATLGFYDFISTRADRRIDPSPSVIVHASIVSDRCDSLRGPASRIYVANIGGTTGANWLARLNSSSTRVVFGSSGVVRFTRR
jgi:hypothetical protein